MRGLLQSVLGYIRKYELIRAGHRVAVAVSGGADSVALLRILLELRHELGIVLSVVHLNHQLRATESDADEQFVDALASAHGLEIKTERRDVKNYAAENKLSLEAAARVVRYEFFRCVLQSGVDCVATAHTLDDQAETVLLKLSRGAGTRGMAGIYPRVAVSHPPSAVRENNSEQDSLARTRWVIRPLLGTRRLQLREYLAEIGQEWREDATNQDMRHTRNRIRQEVLPVLEHNINSAICEVLAETAQIARADEEYWAAEVDRLLPQVWSKEKKGGSLDSRTLARMPVALRRRLVRAAAESLGLALEFRHVEGILELARSGECVSVPSGWIVSLRESALCFRNSPDELAGVPSDYCYELSIPGRVQLKDVGIQIEAIVVGAENDQRYESEHLIDSSVTKTGLVVRNWRSGERFWPAHTRTPKKIKELLQDRHITGPQKKLWPVVASGTQVIWMRGFGVRRDFQAQGNRGILIIETTPE